MKWLVDRIHERRLKAGLWVAPFLIGAGSRLWHEHPQWAVQHKPGRPSVAMINWGQDCYALDLTRSDVIEWLETVFRIVFNDWGFDYIKIDFIYAGAVDGIHFDPNVTRAQAYRRGIEAIRKVAGDRFILGCGNSIGPSIGIVDGSRIGPDVAPFWHPVRQSDQRNRNEMSEVSTLNAIRNTLSRFWMHGQLWLNDPDCLLARDSETALTDEEVRTLATVIGLSGGLVLDSDNLARLSKDRRRIISLLLPPYGRSAVPLDLFRSEMPELFELDCASHKLLGVFNWDDEPATVDVALPPSDTHVFEVWSQQYLGVHRGHTSFDIRPHGVKLLGLRPALDRPQLVGSGFHLLQGACEIQEEVWDGESLRLSLRPVAIREGDLLTHLPRRYGSPKIAGRRGVSIAPERDETWLLRFTLNKPRDLVLRFGG
jgi:alpha-galactosidase